MVRDVAWFVYRLIQRSFSVNGRPGEGTDLARKAIIKSDAEKSKTNKQAER
jgi:hypothetical protein